MKRIYAIAIGLILPYIGYAQLNELNFVHQRIDFSAAPRTTINPMSIKMWDNYNNGGPSNFGTVLEFYGYYGHQTGQLYFGGWDSSKIRYREAFYNENTWSDWITLLDSKNNIQSAGSLLVTGQGNHYIANGNVGVGITNPTDKLQVEGNQISLRNATANNGIIFNADAFGHPAIIPTNANGTVDKHLLLAPFGGNVGIGTATPKEKLSVNGKIRAKEIKVETANWPDYVFQEGYKVRTLQELESYIKANKHLPDMPSAREVEANGLQVGEMLKLQQQKIEELTLHLIEKNNELTAEREKNKFQDLEIKKLAELIRKIDKKIN